MLVGKSTVLRRWGAVSYHFEVRIRQGKSSEGTYVCMQNVKK